jgi:FKBP-type peptidyl-prolyl cis-trans isomerase
MRLIKISTLVALAATLGTLGLFACTKSTPASSSSSSSATAESAGASGPKTDPVTALKIEDVQKGTGEAAVAGKTVTVHYTGWLANGTKFDSSVDRKQPFKFKLGAGQVIPGWDQGVSGMLVGGKRRLTIPPALGYGARGVGPIPPDSTLQFDVELLAVQ